MNSINGWVNPTGSDTHAPTHPQSDLISENHKMCIHPQKQEKKGQSVLFCCANSIFITLFKKENTKHFQETEGRGCLQLAPNKQMKHPVVHVKRNRQRNENKNISKSHFGTNSVLKMHDRWAYDEGCVTNYFNSIKRTTKEILYLSDAATNFQKLINYNVDRTGLNNLFQPLILFCPVRLDLPLSLVNVMQN